MQHIACHGSFIARNASKNSILWVHSSYLDFFDNDEKKYEDFFKSLNSNKFRKIVFVSNKSKNEFIKSFPGLDLKTSVCNNFINYDEILEKSKEKIEDKIFEKDIPCFINISRHDEKAKRISRIINSSKSLRKEGYKFKVIFLGDGKDHKKYLNESKDLKDLIFLGEVKNPYPYLKKADYLLCSSYYEGYPVTFLEAEVLKVPIITTDVSDSKQDIDKKYGIVVKNSEEGVYLGMKNAIQNFEKDKNIKYDNFDYERFNKENLVKIGILING